MPGWRLREVDCTAGSTATGVAVVMAYLFGHAGVEERAQGDPGVDGASAKAAPRSRFGGRTWWRREVRGFGWRLEGFSGRKLSASAPAAAMPAGVVVEAWNSDRKRVV